MTKLITASILLTLAALSNISKSETAVPFTTRHRYVTPNTEVTTNVYGSVTGIVDRAYINELVDISEVTVKDVQVDGVSVVGKDKIANVVTTNFLTRQDVRLSTNEGLEKGAVQESEYSLRASNAGRLMSDDMQQSVFFESPDKVKFLGGGKISELQVDGTEVITSSLIVPSPSNDGYAQNAENALLATKAEYAPMLRDDSTGLIIETADSQFNFTNTKDVVYSYLVPDGSIVLTEKQAATQYLSKTGGVIAATTGDTSLVVENSIIGGSPKKASLKVGSINNTFSVNVDDPRSSALVRIRSDLSTYEARGNIDGWYLYDQVTKSNISGIDDYGPYITKDNQRTRYATIHTISATNTTFSNAVLAVGLNIDTNSVAALNEIASTFGGFPIEGTATTVGGLLAALAAAAAWLKKNKVQTLKLENGSVETSADGGVAKLDDFFTESNSLLTGTIDACLTYPLNAVTDETGLLKDRAINTTSLASVTVPDNFTDLLVRASVASSLAVTMPEAIATKYGDTFPGEAGEYLITITKTGAAEAYVRTIKLEEVA